MMMSVAIWHDRSRGLNNDFLHKPDKAVRSEELQTHAQLWGTTDFMSANQRLTHNGLPGRFRLGPPGLD